MAAAEKALFPPKGGDRIRANSSPGLPQTILPKSFLSESKTQSSPHFAPVHWSLQCTHWISGSQQGGFCLQGTSSRVWRGFQSPPQWGCGSRDATDSPTTYQTGTYNHTFSAYHASSARVEKSWPQGDPATRGSAWALRSM